MNSKRTKSPRDCHDCCFDVTFLEEFQETSMFLLKTCTFESSKTGELDQETNLMPQCRRFVCNVSISTSCVSMTCIVSIRLHQLDLQTCGGFKEHKKFNRKLTWQDPKKRPWWTTSSCTETYGIILKTIQPIETLPKNHRKIHSQAQLLDVMDPINKSMA